MLTGKANLVISYNFCAQFVLKLLAAYKKEYICHHVVKINQFSQSPFINAFELHFERPPLTQLIYISNI